MKGAEASKKFIKSVEAFRASQPGITDRYAQAIRFGVFTVRIGASANPSFLNQFSYVGKAAWSYSGLLKAVAGRLTAVSNTESAQAANVRKVAKDRYGRPETIAGNFEHIVVLGLGTPKVLFTSHNLSTSANSQALLGYIWRNLDPSGARHRWFFESRADILKYHAWKYTAAQALTEDKKDHFKSFAVFEDRDTNEFTVTPCAGTESKNKVADINKAQKECVAQFQKDVNPVRSEKNVRGFFVSGSQFIFSKYEDTRDGNDINKGEIPAYGALGRWLMKVLPEAVQGDFKTPVPSNIHPLEGRRSPRPVTFWFASLVEDKSGKKTKITKRNHYALGEAQAAMKNIGWWRGRNEGPVAKDQIKSSGVILTEDKGEFFPLAINAPGLALDSREALTAIGGLLAAPQIHKPKARNLFEKCKDQTAFNGKLSIIFEDPKSGDVIREECQFCATQYAETAAKLLKARPNLKNAQKEQQTAAFDAAYAAVFKEEIAKKKAEYKFGAALLNSKHEFVTVADGDESMAGESHFALGKYANTRCKTLQEIRSAAQAGIQGKTRTTG